MRYSKIPSELKRKKQWVCAWENSKIPMQANQKKAASTTNTTHWVDYDTALEKINNNTYDYLGFVFNGDGIVGIDIDCGYDEDGFLTKTAIDIITNCTSYTEVSKSGRGVHILIKGDIPFKGKNNRKGVEIYKASRFFVMTGKEILYPRIIENQTAIDYVINKYFSQELKDRTNTDQNRELIYKPIYPKPRKDLIVLRPIYPTVEKGMRNLSMTSLAGQLHNKGYSKKEIYVELLYANSVACDPPLSSSEIESICNSVTRYKRRGTTDD